MSLLLRYPAMQERALMEVSQSKPSVSVVTVVLYSPICFTTNVSLTSLLIKLPGLYI